MRRNWYRRGQMRRKWHRRGQMRRKWYRRGQPGTGPRRKSSDGAKLRILASPPNEINRISESPLVSPFGLWRFSDLWLSLNSLAFLPTSFLIKMTY